MLRNATRVLLSALALGAVVAATSSGTANATDPSATRALDHTARHVVRPVTTAGRPVTGYTVHRESGSTSCWGQATTSVSAKVDTCYPTAYYFPSCWKSTDHTALCLRYVSDTELVRVRYSGTFAAKPAVRHPSPQRLTLLNGATCDIRIGGAWGVVPGHPSWVGFYSCTNGPVYGPPSGDGVDRSHPVWRIHLVRGDGSVVTRRVAKATYVGTAS
ncbi:MAG TPA: hypothetical protein VN088_16845 [Nocardioides sp.]|nr:hypothetical protein [Nocardioides sp.]